MKKKKKTVLKTITLSPPGDDDDSPSFSLCPGHVSAKEFQKAYLAEGWSGGCEDHPPEQDELRYEYWLKLKKLWRRAHPGIKGAKPVTVMNW